MVSSPNLKKNQIFINLTTHSFTFVCESFSRTGTIQEFQTGGGRKLQSQCINPKLNPPKTAALPMRHQGDPWHSKSYAEALGRHTIGLYTILSRNIDNFAAYRHAVQPIRDELILIHNIYFYPRFFFFTRVHV